MNDALRCPFKVGDHVRYTPSARGLALDVMSSPETKLVPNRVYRVKRVEEGQYLVVEGIHHPGGGLFWTEFSKADEEKSA